MIELLFDVGDSLSPRLEWMQRHNVHTEYVVADGEWTALDPRRAGKVGHGKTEDDAMFDLCKQMRWRWYTEERYVD